MDIPLQDYPPLPSRRTKQQSRRKKNSPKNIGAPISPSLTTTINHLPDELILNILDFLPGIDIEHFQLPSLLSLSLTSHRFHRLVAERLFLTYDSHFCEPYLFLRTVSSHPHLGKLVRHVNVVNGRWVYNYLDRYTASAQDKKAVKEALRKLDIPKWKYWAANCNNIDVNNETLHSTILMFTPNITSLRIHDTEYRDHDPPKWPNLLTKATTGMAFGHVHQFENLRSIHVSATHYCLAELSILWRLQNLHELHVRNLDAVEPGKGHTISTLQRLIPPAYNKLEEIILDRSFFNMDILRILIASSQTLKRLKLGITSENLPIDVDVLSLLGPTDLVQALESQKACLESFRLYCDLIVTGETLSALGMHKKFKAFTALKYFNCPLAHIIASPHKSSTILESLPPSLVTFHTTFPGLAFDTHCLDSLKNAAIHLQTSESKLEQVQLVVPSRKDQLPYDWESLVKSFSQTKVNFVLMDSFGNILGTESTDSSESSDEVSLYSN